MATGLEANRIDYEAVYVESGSLNLTDATATEVAVGLATHAQASVVDLTVSEAGVGAQSLGATSSCLGSQSITPVSVLRRWPEPTRRFACLLGRAWRWPWTPAIQTASTCPEACSR